MALVLFIVHNHKRLKNGSKWLFNFNNINFRLKVKNGSKGIFKGKMNAWQAVDKSASADEGIYPRIAYHIHGFFASVICYYPRR